MRLLLLGNPGAEHVGSHFRQAASELSIDTIFSDARQAYAGPVLARRINWWLRGRRPARLSEASTELVSLCKTKKPDVLLTTGIAPMLARHLKQIRDMGIRAANFLTDDPWNRRHSAPWFMEALPNYDYVFTTRRANRDDLLSAGCRSVEYLPFAFAPHIHYQEPIPNH